MHACNDNKEIPTLLNFLRNFNKFQKYIFLPKNQIFLLTIIGVGGLMQRNEQYILRTVAPGGYIHIGLENQLKKGTEVLLPNTTQFLQLDIDRIMAHFGKNCKRAEIRYIYNRLEKVSQ